MARATNIQVTIDPKLLAAELTRGKNGMITGREVRRVIQDDIEKIQDKIVNRFLNHPVSKEIMAGPRATNSSGTLAGYGNLFSFLGFDSSSNPLAVIESMLAAKIKYKVRAIGNGKFSITINIPKPEEIFSQTPMPWAGSMSWSESIEQGVSNLASYLFNPAGFPNSASGTGLQSANSVSGVSFKTTPYITALLKEFRKDLTKL